MNIIQLFDQLNIDKEKLVMFSDSDIIRIEKEINIERKINPEINANVAANLVLVLKNYRNPLLYILNYRPLYNLFSGKQLPRSSFANKPTETYENQVKTFINEFLDDDLSLFLDQQIAKNNFEDLYDLLLIKRHFPDSVLYKIEKKIHGKADFSTAKISQKIMDLSDIDFVQKSAFYKVMNELVSIETDDKIRNLINVVVVKYNNNYSKEFFSNTMTSMFNYKAFDEDLHKVIEDNKNAMFGNTSRQTKNNNSTNKTSKTSWLSVGFLFFAIIKILLLISKCDSNSATTNNYNVGDSLNTQNFDPYKAVIAAEKTTDFYDYLTSYDSKTISNKIVNTNFKTGQNPFSTVYNQLSLNFSNKQKINFQNNSDFDMVVLMNMNLKIVGDFANRKFKSPKAAFYLKSKEQFRIDNDTTNGLTYSFYFGNKLSSFETDGEQKYRTKDSIAEFRFLKLARNADKLIRQDLIFTKDVEIYNENNGVNWKMKL